MDQSQMERLLSTAVAAASQAGDWTLGQMHNVESRVKKGTTGEELVTPIDTASQTMLIDRIRMDFPDHGFIGEEGLRGPILHIPPKKSEEVWWVIDPIDGTNNFANGIPFYAVSLAAMAQGRPVVGVIYEPATESVYAAREGQEATFNGQSIHATDKALSAFTSVGLDSHIPVPITPWIQRIMEDTRYRNLGATTLHLSLVSRGAMAACVTFVPKLWDIAAGALIVERAGGKVTDLAGQSIWPIEPMRYQGQSLPMLAGNPKAHAQILEWMKAKPSAARRRTDDDIQ